MRLTIVQILSHYNIIGLSIAVAIGIAGKDLIFSLANDVILPIFLMVLDRIKGSSVILKGKNKLDIITFISALLTFMIVVGAVIIILNTILKPVVKQDIIAAEEEKEKIDNIEKNLEKNGKKIVKLDNMLSHDVTSYEEL